MNLYELSEQEFRDFLDRHPLKTFLQTPEIAHLREKNGWTIYYVGLKDKDKVIAATMMMSIGNFMGKKTFYAPRGVLIDYENQNLLTLFFQELKQFVKNHQGYVFKMDPYYELVERDSEGKIVTSGFNHTDVVSHLKRIGFFPINSEQAKWMFALNTDKKSFEELRKDFRPSTRNILNKVLKSNIQIRELEYDELHLFKAITEETSERKRFGDKPLSYYQDMYQVFKPNGLIKYLIAEINIPEYIQSLEKERLENNQKLSVLSDSRYNDKKKEEIHKTLEGISKKLKEAKSIQKEHGNTLILSGGMFILYGDEVVYLYSGNYKRYMNFNAQYKIQWEMIHYAIDHNYKQYNFYGITEFRDKNHKDYGVYDFKKGFNGRVIELIGGFELPITWHYHLHKLLSALKKMGKGNR